MKLDRYTHAFRYIDITCFVLTFNEHSKQFFFISTDKSVFVSRLISEIVERRTYLNQF